MPSHQAAAISRLRAGVFLLLLLPVLFGCQSKKDSLSPGAESFKSEVRQAIGLLADDLAEPVSRSDVPAIKAVLAQKMPESIKLCRACPFMVAVLDRKGVVLTVYPPRERHSRHYSDYRLVAQTLEKGKIHHGRLFLQDGSELYTICAPLRKDGKATGVLVLTAAGREVKQRWGISADEFSSLNFNPQGPFGRTSQENEFWP